MADIFRMVELLKGFLWVRFSFRNWYWILTLKLCIFHFELFFPENASLSCHQWIKSICYMHHKNTIFGIRDKSDDLSLWKGDIFHRCELLWAGSYTIGVVKGLQEGMALIFIGERLEKLWFSLFTIVQIQSILRAENEINDSLFPYRCPSDLVE